MRVRVVTALFDLGRQRDYIQWLLSTCAVPAPMTIFLHDRYADAVPRILAARGNHETTVVLQPIEAVPLWCDVPRVKRVLAQSESVWPRMRAALEFNHPAYTALVHSKPHWVLQAAAITDADVYIWIDAGLSRTWDSDKFLTQPNEAFLQQCVQRAQVAFAVNPTDFEYRKAQLHGNNIWGYAGSGACAGILVGSRAAWQALAPLMRGVWERAMLGTKQVDNEQNALCALHDAGATCLLPQPFPDPYISGAFRFPFMYTVFTHR